MKRFLLEFGEKEELHSKLKSKCAEKQMTMNEAILLAIRSWLNK